MTSNEDESKPTNSSAEAAVVSDFAVGDDVEIVDATVDMPGHGPYRLQGVHGIVRHVGDGDDPDVSIEVDGVEVPLKASQLELPTEADSLGRRVAKFGKKVAWETVGRPAEERRAACRDRIRALVVQSLIIPRPDSLDYPPEPQPPQVPPGAQPRYTAAGAMDAWSAGSDLRAAMQGGRGGIADWNQRKRERENSRANQNSFALQQQQQVFAEAQARYDREFAAYERDVAAYEKYLAGDETWRFQVALAAAQREIARITAVREDLLQALAEEVQLRPREERRAVEHRARELQSELRTTRSAARWVDDPASELRFRYWDGRNLTDTFAPKLYPIPSVKEVVDAWGTANDSAASLQQPRPAQLPAGASSKTAQLKELFELRNAGAISDEEFEQLKSEII
jgi:hypothetical protein